MLKPTLVSEVSASVTTFPGEDLVGALRAAPWEGKGRNTSMSRGGLGHGFRLCGKGGFARYGR